MTRQASRYTSATARIVAVYALFGLVWIYGSDTALGWLVKDHAVMVKIAVIKGSLFIVTTAALLFFLISRFARQIDAAERRELESLKGYLAIFNATNEAIFVHDAQSGRILDVNDRMLEIFGVSREEALNLDIARLSEGHPPYGEAEATEKLRRAMAEGPQVFEWHSRRKNGELFWSEISLKRVATDDYDRIIAVVRDVSERRLLEEQLRQSQKLESIGRLAGGVAHDFNNMLSVIVGYAQLSLLKLPEDDPYHEVFQQILKAAERSSEITRQLLAFSRKEVIAPRPLDLNQVILATEKNLGRLIGEDIELTFRPAAGLWLIKADPVQVDQILMNLAANARDAMPDGGVLTITTGNICIDEDYSRYCLDAHPGEYVLLTVNDTGVGMDREIREHIFEPFFTTKNRGAGTGLGLATVYGILVQNNGFIECHSERGQGSVFRCYLPRLPETEVPAEEAKEAKEPERSQGSGTILLVEDEEMLLQMSAKMLEEMGYRVIQNQSPEEALARCQKGEPFDLVLTDVVMPGMNGKEMAEKMKAVRPGIKVLFMSGYTSEIVAKRGIIEDGMHYIQKPIDMTRLREKIKEVLADRR
ncbi:hybrid sensor histidine kinase/response regulator [Geomesophilobacter sediminis]|uniref:histidine kinase n=1 Tax=Geomesophilobacter sediminis TaxID=2798584 RepID=A0A8J7M0D2_9BACT|nr:response regulator [Geomesophilobacter sediminis]MBJ6724572.1 response regulator [Geomesophilobacter sediminis]